MKLHLPRFLSRSLAAGLLLLGAPLIAQDAFTSFAGTYQGLLVEAPSGDPAGRIDFTITSKGSLSGSLLLKNQKSYKFKRALTLAGDAASTDEFDVVKPKVDLALKLSLTIADDGSFTVDGNALVPNFTGDFVQLEDSASRLRFYKAKTDNCPWAGVFGLAFHDAVNNGDETPPGGASIGSATIKPDGVMSVKGTLADGTKFTASARPSEDGTYRFFIGVHKTAGSYFTTFFRLTKRDDDWYHVAADQGSARWAKSPNSKDKSYRDGFDASFDASVVQWKAPGKGETLRDLLGLGSDNVLAIDFFGGLSPVTYKNFLPTSLGLTLKNTFRIASTAGNQSVINESNWAKIFAGKVDPKTGLISVTLNISDTVSGKTLKRKIVTNGVFLQLENDELTVPYAYGHMLIPPLVKGEPILSGGFDMPGPVQLDPLYAAAGNTAGTYTAVLTMLEGATPMPTGVPPNGATVNFTLSGNLRELNFNGRKIPLQGDSRPTSLVYSDATSKPTNNLTVTLYLNGSGVVHSLATQYFQVAGFTVKVRNHTSNNVTKQ